MKYEKIHLKSEAEHLRSLKNSPEEWNWTLMKFEKFKIQLKIEAEHLWIFKNSPEVWNWTLMKFEKFTWSVKLNTYKVRKIHLKSEAEHFHLNNFGYNILTMTELIPQQTSAATER